MNETSETQQRRAFARWLRTGRLPSPSGPDGLELKFNPWHDPADGRFTFGGAGGQAGASAADATSGASGRASAHAGRVPSGEDQPTSRVGTLPTAKARALNGQTSTERGTVQKPPTGASGAAPNKQRNTVAEFASGVGEGIYAVGEDTVEGVHAALTTNPVTTVRNAGRGIANMIDAAITAEDTPAHVQVSRAADAIANASARDIGRATGSVAGNVALAVLPGASISKVSALRRLRMARPSTTFDPPQIGWVKEKIKEDAHWKPYNDSATGARPDQAPTLMRTMPDGSKRPVKFDGFQGDYVIDRKWKVVDAPHARAQLLRQSQVLAEHHLIGTWEVPNAKQMMKAIRLFKKMNVTNIKVRIVKP